MSFRSRQRLFSSFEGFGRTPQSSFRGSYYGRPNPTLSRVPKTPTRNVGKLVSHHMPRTNRTPPSTEHNVDVKVGRSGRQAQDYRKDWKRAVRRPGLFGRPTSRPTPPVVTPWPTRTPTTSGGYGIPSIPRTFPSRSRGWPVQPAPPKKPKHRWKPIPWQPEDSSPRSGVICRWVMTRYGWKKICRRPFPTARR